MTPLPWTSAKTDVPPPGTADTRIFSPKSTLVSPCEQMTNEGHKRTYDADRGATERQRCAVGADFWCNPLAHVIHSLRLQPAGFRSGSFFWPTDEALLSLGSCPGGPDIAGVATEFCLAPAPASAGPPPTPNRSGKHRLGYATQRVAIVGQPYQPISTFLGLPTAKPRTGPARTVNLFIRSIRRPCGTTRRAYAL